ncbi:hypothetical protein [Candidatus Tisiphia endosymbiont of Oplodontha viridula]|uniref:hypothetical protein n=1 Tax=Candidatus Tisiphia endosymbiont of Oplodontha viridula TaxID=3077925 RepID=UPI0035C8D2D6
MTIELVASPGALFVQFKNQITQEAKMSREEIISLVNQGLNLGTVDEYGYSTLLLAAENGQNEVVKFILEQKNNISYNALTLSLPLNSMALYLAHKNGHADVEQTILDDATLNGIALMNIDDVFC